MNKEKIEQHEKNAPRVIDDLTLSETETEKIKGGIIGLLLPAIQKVR